MRKYLILFAFSQFILFNHGAVFAQSTDSLKISGIPKWLKWENKPVKYYTDKSSITIFSGEKMSEA